MGIALGVTAAATTAGVIAAFLVLGPAAPAAVASILVGFYNIWINLQGLKSRFQVAGIGAAIGESAQLISSLKRKAGT